MKHVQHIAKHFRDVHFGGNWTAVNLRETLSEVTWQEATKKKEGYNTIAALAYHIHYFVATVNKVLEGGPLDGHDKYSFDVPTITSSKEWNDLLEGMWTDAEKFATLVEKLSDDKLWEPFCEEKYGNYYRNLNGIIEHSHYHLGQIVILKKILRS